MPSAKNVGAELDVVDDVAVVRARPARRRGRDAAGRSPATARRTSPSAAGRCRDGRASPRSRGAARPRPPCRRPCADRWRRPSRSPSRPNRSRDTTAAARPRPGSARVPRHGGHDAKDAAHALQISRFGGVGPDASPTAALYRAHSGARTKPAGRPADWPRVRSGGPDHDRRGRTVTQRRPSLAGAAGARQRWIASSVTRRAWIRHMTRVSRSRCPVG